MPITSTTVTVGTTPTLLAEEDRGRRFIAFANNSGGDVHLGGVGVTTTSGILLEHKEDLEYQQQHPNDHTPGQAWYGIVDMGTKTIGVTIASENAAT